MSNEAKISPFAGHLPKPEDLIHLPGLLQAYDSDQPDPNEPAERVSFGTSGHRGSSLSRSFNRNHVLAMSQAVCLYRKAHNIDGPLFLGFDTHALSFPAFQTTLEVLAANGVTVMTAEDHKYTPTPVISHAILCYNRGRTTGLADGIVITPSHNPPAEGGWKYNAVHGGPAEKEITSWIESKANEILKNNLSDVARSPFEKAMKASSTHLYNYIENYVKDLSSIIDMDVIRNSKISLAVDPLGGAGVQYWGPIAEQYGLNLKVLNYDVDPCFRFMTRDWDGQIRMDPSSRYVMQSLIQKSKNYDIAFACDTDHDRHGIVTRSAGLVPPNAYLAVAISYLFQNRKLWSPKLKVGKTLVSSQIIDRVAKQLNREIYEVPVGFKWFVDGLHHGTLGFGGEESAGASFLRKDGTAWTTDKDGIILGLLSAEITAQTGKDPSALYQELTESLGNPVYGRQEAVATREEKQKLNRASAEQISAQTLGNDPVLKVLTKAPGNGASIAGIKIETENGWIAIRPSGTEDIYKVYGESFLGDSHLSQILSEGQMIVSRLLRPAV